MPRASSALMRALRQRRLRAMTTMAARSMLFFSSRPADFFPSASCFTRAALFICAVRFACSLLDCSCSFCIYRLAKLLPEANKQVFSELRELNWRIRKCEITLFCLQFSFSTANPALVRFVFLLSIISHLLPFHFVSFFFSFPNMPKEKTDETNEYRLNSFKC